MILLRSVVGKLWFTILLLVSFILFILSIMLLELFQNNNIVETKNDLRNTAEKIASVIEKHNEQFSLGIEISWEIIDDVTNVVIIKDNDEVYYSPNEKLLTMSDIKKDKDLSKVLKYDKVVEKVSPLSNNVNSILRKQVIRLSVYHFIFQVAGMVQFLSINP